MQRARYFRKALTHSCGFPREVCEDQERTFYVRRDVCRADMQMAAYERLYDDRYGGKFHDGSFQRWSDQPSEAFPYSHRDGVSLRLTKTDEQPNATWHLEPRALPVSAADGTKFLTPEPEPEGGDPDGDTA